jgi:hypothetical protein
MDAELIELLVSVFLIAAAVLICYRALRFRSSRRHRRKNG